MEITLPVSGELVSHAKLNALKPTIFISGRQHANEVSARATSFGSANCSPPTRRTRSS